MSVFGPSLIGVFDFMFRPLQQEQTEMNVINIMEKKLQPYGPAMKAMLEDIASDKHFIPKCCSATKKQIRTLLEQIK